jgi:hypothetical protein
MYTLNQKMVQFPFRDWNLEIFGKRLTFFDEPTKIELEKLIIREGRDCERLSQRDAGQLHFM